MASFSWFVPTLLRVLSLALFAVFFMALLKRENDTDMWRRFHIIEHNYYLIMLSVALLLVHSLTQLFILGLALKANSDGQDLT